MAGRDQRDVVQMGAARERVVEDDVLRPGSIDRAERSDGGVHRGRHRPEVHRDVLGLHEEVAVGGEEGGRAVGPLLDVRAEGGPAQHGPHLVGDAGEPGEQHGKGGRPESRRPESAQRRRSTGEPSVAHPARRST